MYPEEAIALEVAEELPTMEVASPELDAFTLLRRYLGQHGQTVDGSVNGAYHQSFIHCKCPICADTLALLGIEGHYEFP